MRRILPFVVAGSLLVAGCADRSTDEGPVAVGDDAAVPSTAAPEQEAAPAETTAAGSPSTTSTTGAGRVAPPTSAPRSPTTTGPAEPPTTAGAAAVDGAVANDGRLGPPGAYARTMLRPRPATRLVVERFHQRGMEPAPRTVSLADATLREVAKKDVEVRASVELPGAGRSWSADDLRALADRSGRVTPGEATAVLKLLFVGGSFEGDASVLGVAVRGDLVAIFSESVDDARTPVLSSDAIEEAVVIHELGHVLGLVDLARDTRRADPDHPGHSPNTRSVMYWAVESSLIGQVLTGPPPREFDAADLADLEALRNGA